MRPFSGLLLLLLLLCPLSAAEPDFPLTEDSKPQPDVPKGTLIKDTFTSRARTISLPNGAIATVESNFPGTVREYTLYLPPGFDLSKRTPFMVFQDGLIYHAPTVFDNLIAKKQIPPLVGVFVKPGVVPALNEATLPRFNRSFEYDSITDAYARFLIDELLPGIQRKHFIRFSEDPNEAAIAGNSSGGIAAFMVAWHRPDRFRRVFTGVGTYVGINGGDQLSVLIRKVEPKPLKIFLQSGSGDNNLYCGDWWMANQMMERSLTWAGYDVNHAWGEGGHNQKHASQIFPEVLRWLWKGWPDAKEVKVNPRGDSQWKGHGIVGGGAWQTFHRLPAELASGRVFLTPKADGTVYFAGGGFRGDIGDWRTTLSKVTPEGKVVPLEGSWNLITMAMGPDGALRLVISDPKEDNSPRAAIIEVSEEGQLPTPSLYIEKGTDNEYPTPAHLCYNHEGRAFFTDAGEAMIFCISPDGEVTDVRDDATGTMGAGGMLCFSPDQGTLYGSGLGSEGFWSYQIHKSAPFLRHGQAFNVTQHNIVEGKHGWDGTRTMCVDTNGWLYLATSQGIQVLDQCGRVNCIIATPKPPQDICFGGKDLSDLIISCRDDAGALLYRRPTKARGLVSAQSAPIKPAPPKL